MIDNINDQYMLSTMRGAPVMQPAAGSFITACDALLLTGWGAVTASSGVVVDGVCTMTVNAGESFDLHALLQISGASPVGLNGVARVIAATATTVSFKTEAPNGLVTGPVSLRYAPAPGSWEKVYSAANKAVYRSTHPASSGMCLRVEDTGSVSAVVRGYRSMTDVDTGIEPFPTLARLSSPLWSKTSGSTARPYLLWADCAGLVCALPNSATSWAVQFFGDPLAVDPMGDPYGCALSAQGTVGETGVRHGLTSGSYSGVGLFPCRKKTGETGAAMAVRSLLAANSAVSGGDTAFGVAADAYDGKLIFSQLGLSDATNGPLRACLPAVLHVPMTGLLSHALGDVVEQDDAVALAVPINSGGARSGTAFIELGRGRA